MPDKRRRVLVLSGTGEARELATQAARQLPDNIEIISSYAGRTKRAKEPPGTIREGGFGGAEGLKNFIRTASIDLLIDATHPFATVISSHAALATKATGCPRLALRRSDWILPEDAKVTEAKNMAEAADWLSGHAGRVFLSTGSQGLEAFTNLKEVWFLIRVISTPQTPLPLAHCKIIIARPPFLKPGEISLLRENGIEFLISKHSGGPIPAKIPAAVELGIPIILIRQPDPPSGENTNDISMALSWIRDKL